MLHMMDCEDKESNGQERMNKVDWEFGLEEARHGRLRNMQEEYLGERLSREHVCNQDCGKEPLPPTYQGHSVQDTELPLELPKRPVKDNPQA